MKFAIVDVDQAALKGAPKNVEGLLFREEQVGYLVGYLGALTAKRDGADTISVVGGFKGLPSTGSSPAIRPGGGGRTRHHRRSYSQDWDDQAKCKELALDQIASGSAVVFQVAGGCGLGALSAAKDRDVWGIGVDADQSFLGPHILTSALKGVDQAVFLTIGAVGDGTWQGGRNAVFGLDQEGVPRHGQREGGRGRREEGRGRDRADPAGRDRRHPDDGVDGSRAPCNTVLQGALRV